MIPSNHSRVHWPSPTYGANDKPKLLGNGEPTNSTSIKDLNLLLLNMN